jgi:S1-C subfamily serine protease
MRRMMLAGVVLIGLIATPAAAQQLDQTAVQRGLDSTVFIKSERVFRGLFFPSFGTGFFVHPDGLVLTNWHVVANQIEVRMDGKEREISTKVVVLEVVIDSGEPTEKTIQAEVVALDRTRDLALLKVPFQPKVWLDIADPPTVSLAQSIWLVGYPLGNMLTADMADGSVTKEDIPNPSASINRGMVTSLRKDSAGILRTIQIDAAVNPGNSGGPLFDLEGRVVGVVNAKIVGAEGLGFAISGFLVREFAAKKSAHVKFDPPSVNRSPAQPIHVTVDPILADLGDAVGRLKIKADGMAPIEVAFEPQGLLWQAEIPIPDLDGEGPGPDDYYVDIVFTAADGSTAIDRKFRLKGSSAPLRVASQRDPKKMLEDRRQFSNELSISDYTKSGGTGGSSTRSLSDVAKNTKLKRSSSGSIVIDDHTLTKLTSPLEKYFNPERYDQIADASERALAKEYDLVKWVHREIESRLHAVSTYLQNENYRVRSAAAKAKRELLELQPEVEREYQNLERRIRYTDLVFCHDREKWFHRHSCPCEAPEVP